VKIATRRHPGTLVGQHACQQDSAWTMSSGTSNASPKASIIALTKLRIPVDLGSGWYPPGSDRRGATRGVSRRDGQRQVAQRAPECERGMPC